MAQSLSRGSAVGRIDYAWLGDRLELTPAGIQNAAFRAAFFAREDAQRPGEEACIAMKHILQASWREYQKEGRAFLASDLQPYFPLAFS